MTIQLRPYQHRTLTTMLNEPHGKVIIPTGGGKTMVMIHHAIEMMNASSEPLTFLISSPRIQLTVQLAQNFSSLIPGAEIIHVHSGSVDNHMSTTKPDMIRLWDSRNTTKHRFIFSTYNSLNRIVSSKVNVDCFYFDECHHTVKPNFHDSVRELMDVPNRYFFTATARNGFDPYGRGMNNKEVYGEIIATVSATELISSGALLSPTVVSHEIKDEDMNHSSTPEFDCSVLMDMIDNVSTEDAAKILVACPSSNSIWGLVSESNCLNELKKRGYNVFHITSKFGAWINNTKVSRKDFFKILNEWSKCPNTKYVIFHYSILSEGIDIPGLTHCFLLRSLPLIEMAQTIGRVIRMHPKDVSAIQNGEIQPGDFETYHKKTGFVTVPMASALAKSKETMRKLNAMVDTIFIQGKPLEVVK